MKKPAKVAQVEPKRPHRSGPRMPSRGRGVVRYAALVEATDRLLWNANPDAVGLYQIAEEAKVPPASVYHFFPTKEAAFLAVAQKNLETMQKLMGQPIDASALHSWQDLYETDVRRSMAYYNSHPPFMKILYGGYGGVETRNIDAMFSKDIAYANYDRLNSIFHMPVLREPGRIFEVRLAILDAIWAVSYRRHGEITEYYCQEVIKAGVAYMRIYLPAHVERRDWLIEAAARGEQISLPQLKDSAPFVPTET